MPNGSLDDELETVTAALREARTEYARLGARIAGLAAQRSALTHALSAPDAPSASSPQGNQHRTDDIVEVLLAKGTPMSIKEVVSDLREARRVDETYENVSVDLAYLAGRSRVERVKRGVYAAKAVVRADGAERRLIELTQGNISNGHVYLSRCLDFFPDDALGGPNRNAGVGKDVELVFTDAPDARVWTDIASDKKIFRERSAWRSFFERQQVRPGDSVALDRQSERGYHVSVLRAAREL